MAIICQNKSPERTICVTRRNGYYSIEVHLPECDGRHATMHTETNRQRAEGVYYYLLDNPVYAVNLAREIIEREQP